MTSVRLCLIFIYENLAIADGNWTEVNTATFYCIILLHNFILHRVVPKPYKKVNQTARKDLLEGYHLNSLVDCLAAMESKFLVIRNMFHR